MRAFFSTLWNLAAAGLGTAVFFGLMWYFARIHSFQWRLVAETYSGQARTRRVARKVPEVAVFTGRKETKLIPSGGVGYRVHAGVNLAVHQDGLALTLIPPFNIMCPPLFLPYDEMEVAPTWWGLLPNPFAVRMKRAPNIDIILRQDAVQWLRDHSQAGPFQPASP